METYESVVASASDPLVHIDQTIMQLGWLVQRQFMQLLADQRFDLTIPQFFTLLHLDRCPSECRMSDLARATQQSAASLTGVVDRLLDKRLVERLRPADDRRQVMVALTARGRELLADIRQARREEMQISLSGLRPDELLALLHPLDCLLAGLLHSAEERERQ